MEINKKEMKVMESNKDKFSMSRRITPRDILEWLDGCAVSYVATEKQIDSIDGRYCSKDIRSGIFSKDKYDRINLSNVWYLSMEKSFLDEYESKKNGNWITLSRNSIRKCDTVDDMIKMIMRVLSPYLHFHISGRSYDYINIKKIISRDGFNVYRHDKSGKIMELMGEIRRHEEELAKLKVTLKKVSRYQSIHMNLKESVTNRFYWEGKHYL